MKNIYLILLFFAVISLSNCKKPNEIKPEKHIYPPRLNITDAKAIFTFDANNNSENVFKITNENKVDTVKYINTDGQTIYPNPTIFGIGRELGIVNIYGFGVGENFILIKNYHQSFWDESGKSINSSKFSVVNKTTGQITDISSIENYYFGGTNPLQKSNDNYYFSAGGQKDAIYKFNSSFIMEQYSITDNTIWGFCVNSSDYIVFTDADNNYNTKCFLQSPSNYIYSISDNVEGEIKTYWLGTDGEFYIYCDNSPTNNVNINKIVINGNEISTQRVFESTLSSINLFGSYGYGASHLKQKLNNAVLFVPYKRTGKWWVFDEITNEFKDFSSNMLQNAEVYDVGRSDNYFYIATKNNIYKYDFNYNYTNMLNQNDYDIYSISVSKNNEVIFNGVRNTDGKVIIGIIKSTGNVEIIDDKLNKKVENIKFL